MKQKGFFGYEDGITRGKGLSALKNSRDNYAQLISLFEGKENIPSSVMKAKREFPTTEVDEHAARRTYESSGRMVRKGLKVPKSLSRTWKVSGSGAAGGALSVFPQQIGKSMVRFYTEPGDVIYDPFAGHNSRMDLVIACGRDYMASDLSTEFMAFNKQRSKTLLHENPGRTIRLYHGDSRKVPFKSRSADFTITSPPYWCIEYYGDEPKQLGKSEDYGKFLGGMLGVLKENFRILKPGAFAAYFVNDFRWKGVFYSYHSDIIRLGRKAGFEHTDILITDLGRGFGDIFINRSMRLRQLPKRHEFGVIFRKPKGEDKTWEKSHKKP